MTPIQTYKGRPVVRDWKELAQLASGRYQKNFEADSPEYRRAWNTYSGGASGGYLLDVELARIVWDKARAIDGPLNRCRYFRTIKHEFWLPTFNESSRVTGSRWGGVRAYWKGQKDDNTLSQSKPGIGRVDFQIQDLYIYSEPFSNDLIDDAPLVEDLLTYAAHQEIMYAVTDVMLNGKGEASPLGILNAPATVSVTRNTGSAIKYQDIDDMWSKLWGPCRRNAVWHCTDSVIDAIDQVATAFNWPESMYQPSGSTSCPYPMIKGRPVITVETLPAVGTFGDLVVADWTQYAICVHVPDVADPGPTMELAFGSPSMGIEQSFTGHKNFNTDESIYRFKARLDGKPLWAQKVTLADGSGQQNGPFVALL